LHIKINIEILLACLLVKDFLNEPTQAASLCSCVTGTVAVASVKHFLSGHSNSIRSRTAPVFAHQNLEKSRKSINKRLNTASTVTPIIIPPPILYRATEQGSDRETVRTTVGHC
jgi:hypothetical protein